MTLLTLPLRRLPRSLLNDGWWLDPAPRDSRPAPQGARLLAFPAPVTSQFPGKDCAARVRTQVSNKPAEKESPR